MSSSTGKRKRTEGACASCRKKKRKCDQLRPKCSQCIKNNDTCEISVFRCYSDQGSASRRRSRAQPQFESELDVSARQCSHSDIGQSHVKSLKSTLQNIDGEASIAHQHKLDGHASALGYHPHDSDDPMHDQHQPFFSAFGSEDNPVHRHFLVGYAVQPAVVATGSLACSSAGIAKSLPERFLWDFFLKFSQNTFTCFDSKDTSRFPTFQNPFGSLIPRMALSSGSLRAAILCFSAMQYTFRTGGGGLVWRDEILYSRAIFHLVSNSAEAASLLPIITAGLFLHFCDQENNQNFLDVARSAAAYLADLVDNGHYLPSAEFQTVMSLLRWADISTLCSLRSLHTFIDEDIHQRIELRQHDTIHPNFSDLDAWISHPVFPFSTHLINPLLRLGRLIQYTTVQTLQAREPISNIEQKILQLEEDILGAVNGFRTSQLTEKADCEPLIHLNSAMHSAALLLFYSRLRKMPFTTTLVRQYVQELVDHVELISIGSPTCNAIFFPLLVAGCEAVDLTTRCLISERISHHHNIPNFEKCTTSLQQIWAIRDAEPGLLWPAWRDKVDPQFQISILF